MLKILGSVIVILGVEEISGEDSLIRIKIGDGEHWWSHVRVGPQMFTYYRSGAFTRGRMFTIRKSHMENNTLVIVSASAQFIKTLINQLYHPQTNMIFANKGTIIPDEDLMMIPVSTSLFQERRKTTKTGISTLTYQC